MPFIHLYYTVLTYTTQYGVDTTHTAPTPFILSHFNNSITTFIIPSTEYPPSGTLPRPRPRTSDVYIIQRLNIVPTTVGGEARLCLGRIDRFTITHVFIHVYLCVFLHIHCFDFVRGSRRVSLSPYLQYW